MRISKNDALKDDTKWYDDLCWLYQINCALSRSETAYQIRNLLWEQVKGLVQGRVHEFIRNRRAAALKYDKDLSQKLFQESFFVFVKACDVWDSSRKTKFLTFLGDILDQEILNIIRLDNYHKFRDKKLEIRINQNSMVDDPEETVEDNLEKNKMFDEIKDMIENFPFENPTERDVIYTIIYGKMGDWAKLRERLGLGIGKLYKIRSNAIQRLREHILQNCSSKVREVINEVVNEK